MFIFLLLRGTIQSTEKFKNRLDLAVKIRGIIFLFEGIFVGLRPCIRKIHYIKSCCYQMNGSDNVDGEGCPRVGVKLLSQFINLDLDRLTH